MILRFFAEMAARSAAAPSRWRRPLLAWLDGVDRGWGIGAMIAAFSGIWFLFFVVAYLSNDLHSDVLEAWSLGRDLSWGGSKHPPLVSWVARGWSELFPLTDWSFQLLAMLNAALALWAVDLIARRFVSGDKRAMVLLLAMLLPAYQFHAQRLNANTVLLAIWPLAIYCFLRAFETRGVLVSIATGLLAALAMLGKYYSVFLLLSILFAALAHPDRARYWRSASPWMSLVTLFVVLAPHIHWLLSEQLSTFSYAIEVQSGISSWQAAREASMFLLGIVAAFGLPALVWFLAHEARFEKVRVEAARLQGGLRLLLLLGMGTVVAPVIVSIAMGTYLPSLWALQGLFLFIIVAVAGAQAQVARFYIVNTMVLVFGIALVALTVAAPIHAHIRNGEGANARNYYRVVAAEVTDRWAEQNYGPLRSVYGDEGLALATAFYGAGNPVHRSLAGQAEGGAFLCFANDLVCMTLLMALPQGPSHHTVKFKVARVLWGKASPSAEVVMRMIAPSRPGPTPDDEIEISRL